VRSGGVIASRLFSAKTGLSFQRMFFTGMPGNLSPYLTPFILDYNAAIGGSNGKGCTPSVANLQQYAATGLASPAQVVAPEADSPGSVCLRVKKVAKHFGGLRAVDEVSFDVRCGQIVALIGPNGAGKSTLFNLISGIERPTAGRILLRDRDMAGVSIHQRGADIGRSFQVPRLVPNLTVIENVMSRLDHLPNCMNERDKEATARAQLAAFDLSQLADLLLDQIGIGQHKLIELARASIGSAVCDARRGESGARSWRSAGPCGR